MAMVDLHTEAGRNCLTKMFGETGDIMEAEFPLLHQEIKKQTAKKRLRSATVPTMWEDGCNIVADYLVHEGMLRVSGYLYLGQAANYVAATLTLSDGTRMLGQYRYALNRNTLRFEEKIRVQRGEVKKIKATLQYFFGMFIMQFSVGSKAFDIEVSDDIVSETLIGHPRKINGNEGVINIIYNRDGNYDYKYNQSGAGSSAKPFKIQFPFMVGVVLDAGYTLLQIETGQCEASLLAQGQPPRKFANQGAVRMTSANQWQCTAGYEALPLGDFLKKIQARNGYVLEFPQDWKVDIEPQSAEGQHKYELSLRAYFRCTDGQVYQLKVDSREFPQGSSYPLSQFGNQAEVPYFHILWGCIGKDTPVQLSDAIVPVSATQIGDAVLTQDGYKKIVNIAEGTEEIMFFAKAEGLEQGIFLTRHHPILTQAGWKTARELKIGDKLLCEGGAYRAVQEIYPEPYYDKVFSLELEGSEGFWAGGYYVGDLKKQNNMGPKQEPLPELPPEFLAELKKFQKLK